MISKPPIPGSMTLSSSASFISSCPARRTKGIGGVLPGGATVAAVADAATSFERAVRVLMPPNRAEGVKEDAMRVPEGAAHRERDITAATTGRRDRAAVDDEEVDADAIEEDASVERIVASFCAFSLY